MTEVNLDLRGQPADQQLTALHDRYRELRGQGATIRALIGQNPVRLYVSLLEGGYRVRLERSGADTTLVLRPDGSTPRRQPGAHSLVVHPDGRVYVNTTDNRVAVIDGSTRRVLRHIGVGKDPQHLELSPDGSRVYVANSGSDDVSVVDTVSDTVVATGSTGRRPLLPCVASDGSLFLPSGPDETLTALDADGHPLATLPVGSSPHDVAVSPDARWAYQPNSGSHSLTIVDAQRRSVAGELRVGQGPGHIAFTADSRYAFVANTLSDDVSVVSTADHEVIGTIKAGAGAHMPLLSHDGRTGYVADFAADQLTVWDVAERRALGAVAVGIYPHTFGVSPDDLWLVVSNTGESSVCIVDARERRVAARLEVGGGPGHVDFDPAGECAFVGCQLSNQVAVIDVPRQRVIELIDAGLPAV